MGWPPWVAPGGGGMNAPESGSTPGGISLNIADHVEMAKKTRTGVRRNEAGGISNFWRGRGKQKLTPIARRRVTITAVRTNQLCLRRKQARKNKTLSLGLEPRAFASQPSKLVHRTMEKIARCKPESNALPLRYDSVIAHSTT